MYSNNSLIANNTTSTNLITPKWITVKCILGITIFTEAFISAILIERLKHYKCVSMALLHILGSLVAGMILAGGIISLPQGVMIKYSEIVQDPNFQWPFITIGLTILLLITIEKIINIILKLRYDSNNRQEQNYCQIRTCGISRIESNITVNTIYSTSPIENTQFLEGQPLVGNEFVEHSHFNPSLLTEKWYIAVLLICALSIHSIFEGIGVGATTSLKMMFSVYGLVILHKGLVSASLGAVMLQYHNTFTFLRYYILIGIFSIMSPIGVIIGIVLSVFASNYSLFEVVINSITVGTFIFISLSELIPQFLLEIESKCLWDVTKIIAFIFGFSLELIITEVQPAAY